MFYSSFASLKHFAGFLPLVLGWFDELGYLGLLEELCMQEVLFYSWL